MTNERFAVGAALVVAAMLAALAPAACSDDAKSEPEDGKAPGPPNDAGSARADAGPAAQGDAGAPAEKLTRIEGPSGTLFGNVVTSFALMTEAGAVSSAGVVVPWAALEGAPQDHAFADDLILGMPDVVVQQTMLQHLRVNWFPGGHAPEPYGEAHFDFHFFRVGLDATYSIDCRADGTLPSADKLPAGYATPEACSDEQGYHAWPTKDVSGGSFTGSLVIGYWHGNIVFLEPMIPRAELAKKQSFVLPVGRPLSAGGTRTLYPGRALVTWDAQASTYTIAFDRFATID